MELCPVCNKLWPQQQVEDHVNECLNGVEDQVGTNGAEMEERIHWEQNSSTTRSEEEDREFALRLIAEEERTRKAEEADNQRLFLELLEREKLEKQRQVESLGEPCPNCKKTKPIEEMYYLDSCTHLFCKECLRQLALTKIEAKKCSSIRCLHESCNKPFSQRDFMDLLSKSEHEHFLAVSVQELIDSSNTFVRCPNAQCGNAIERLNNADKILDKETGPDGKVLSAEAIKHRNEYRFRCRECNTEFCSGCKAIPYHIGFTCEKFTIYKGAEHCRFCGVQLSASNAAPSNGQPPSLKLVCNQKECIAKRDASCSKQLPCGHMCGGIRGEAKCLPCLQPDCVMNDDAQKNSDYCNICWVEDLGSAPSIQLDCGHVFHHSCCSSKITNGWSGARISFGFMDCALCKKQMSHPALAEQLKPMLQLYDVVKAKALQRLQFMKLESSKEVTSPQSPYHNSPEKYALYRFSYFTCFKCKNPYFGGERACEGNQMMEFDPKELVCGGCSDSTGQDNCAKHGKEYIDYKCKFCCNIAVWFCWGNTHFCDECHKKASTIAKVPKKDLPKCTCKLKHPPNGDEFSLGCGLCTSETF